MNTFSFRSLPGFESASERVESIVIDGYVETGPHKELAFRGTPA